MSEFCRYSFDGLGTKCDRCGCWARGTEPPPCPPYVTRYEPDGSRLPQIKTPEDNRLACERYLDQRQGELSHANGEHQGEEK